MGTQELDSDPVGSVLGGSASRTCGAFNGSSVDTNHTSPDEPESEESAELANHSL